MSFRFDAAIVPTSRRGSLAALDRSQESDLHPPSPCGQLPPMTPPSAPFIPFTVPLASFALPST
ncbi:MAG: hypothetical protein ACREEE_06460, partial [Dongiaceae bacterium]